MIVLNMEWCLVYNVMTRDPSTGALSLLYISFIKEAIMQVTIYQLCRRGCPFVIEPF